MNISNKYCSNERIEKFVERISNAEATDLLNALNNSSYDSLYFMAERGEYGNVYITNASGITFGITDTKINYLINCLKAKLQIGNK